MTTRIMYCILLACLLCCHQALGQAQPPGFFQDIQHQAIRIDSADGRKLLIVLLPTQPDTSLVGQLIRFESKHGGQIRIIGVMAPGAVQTSSPVFQKGYGRLAAVGILLTQGLAEADSVTGPRGGILKYLSRKSRNRLTDRFAEGGKYFLSEKGRLFGMLGSNNSLDDKVADYLVQTRVPGEDRY